MSNPDNTKYDNKKDYYERRKGTIIQGGIILLIISGIIYGGYINNEINGKVTEFIIKWENRIKVSNMVNNLTQAKIQSTVSDVIGNLSAHRMVTNETNIQIKELENQTASLIRQFNNTNEVERGKAVGEIVAAVDKNTELLNSITDSLNITKTVNETENAIKTLEKQIEQLRNNTS